MRKSGLPVLLVAQLWEQKTAGLVLNLSLVCVTAVCEKRTHLCLNFASFFFFFLTVFSLPAGTLIWIEIERKNLTDVCDGDN